MSKRTFVLLCLACLGTLVTAALPSHRSASSSVEVSELQVRIQEWAVPTKGAHPHDPAVGADGALWFTEQMVNKIGRLDPNSGDFKEYPLATDKNSGPHGLVADKDGNIWFTANFGGYIGKLDPRTGKVTEYKMPVEKADDPHTAVFDGRGILWFTVQGGNMVGRLDPKSGKIELKEVPTQAALPYGIQISSKGVPVFCELGTNKMASIDPQTLAIKEYPLPDGVRPRRLAIAADDTVYFTDFKSGHLGTLNTTTGEREIVQFTWRGGVESLRDCDHSGWDGLVQRVWRASEYDRAVQSEDADFRERADSLGRRSGSQHGGDIGRARVHRVQRRG